MKIVKITSEIYQIDFIFHFLSENEDLNKQLIKDGFEEDAQKKGKHLGYCALTDNGVKIYFSHIVKKEKEHYIHEIIHAVDFSLNHQGLFGSDNVSNSEIRAYMVTYLVKELKIFSN